MKPSVTVIGMKPTSFAPTRLPQSHGTGLQPTVIGQPPALKASPTAIPAKRAPSNHPARFTPTVMPPAVAKSVDAARPVAPPKDWQPTRLPGVRVDIAPVELADLVSQFPSEPAWVLERVRGLLSASSFAAGTTYWLGFGLAAQEALSIRIKERLSYVERPAMRSVAQHLSRLHALLGDVVESLNGGFLRKSVQRTWQAAEPEIHQLESLLRTSAGDLAEVLDGLRQLKDSCADLEMQLAVFARALEFALDRLPPDVAGIALSRLTSITGSQALLKEHSAYVDLQVLQIQQMVPLILDGVLLKLPSVYGLLANLPPKPSETQRFLAAEKLSELTQLLPR